MASSLVNLKRPCLPWYLLRMPIVGNGLSTVLRTIKHHAIRRSSRTVPRRSLTILGLESSADDSCAAVVTDSREIKANFVIRQDDE